MAIKRDRRLFRRSEGELVVRYSVQKGKKRYGTIAKNLGGGGLRMLILEKLTPGTILDLEIFRKNSKISAKCQGEVIWVSPLRTKGKKTKSFEAGLKFLNLNFLYIGILIGDLEAKSMMTPLSDTA